MSTSAPLNRRSFLKGAGTAAAATVTAGAMASAALADDAAETPAPAASCEFGQFDENGVYTPAFLIPPAPISDDDVVETYDADVVVVGMGLSGICAARAALEEGASVFCIEKGNEWHLHSHQITAINSKVAVEQGVEFSDEQLDRILQQMVKDGRDRSNYNLIKHMVYHCGEDFDWYLEKCPSYTVLDAAQTVAETDLDWQAILNICTDGLAMRAGRHFDDVSEEREQAARDAAPYINLFNYPSNPAWSTDDERYPMFNSVVTVEPNHSYVGKHSAAYVEENGTVKYAVWAKRLATDETGRVTGVYFADIDGNLYKVNAAKGVILATGNFSNNPFLLVDAQGKRFMNEDAVGEVFGAKSMRTAGKVMWQIFDDDFENQVSAMPVGHRCYWRIDEGYDNISLGQFFDPIGVLTRDEVMAMSKFKADTVEELAELMEVPADELQATLDRYNELYDLGVDEDFGKRADRMAPVRKPPFYATPITPPIFRNTVGGVMSDEHVHALDHNNMPIPGLYLAGSMVGNRFHGCYPNTNMGQNHAGCIVYGRLAGTNAAKGI